MTTTNRSGPHAGLVFAAHPTTRGFAWVLFESSTAPVAWGMVHAGAGRKERLLARLERLLDRYEPAVGTLEAFEGRGTARAPRIQQFCRAMVHEMKCRAIETVVFDHDAVEMTFARFGASTRSEIAQAIAKHIDAFSHRLPRARKLGDSQDARQSLFDAAALALTYFAYRGDLD